MGLGTDPKRDVECGGNAASAELTLAHDGQGRCWKVVHSKKRGAWHYIAASLYMTPHWPVQLVGGCTLYRLNRINMKLVVSNIGKHIFVRRFGSEAPFAKKELLFLEMPLRMLSNGRDKLQLWDQLPFGRAKLPF